MSGLENVVDDAVPPGEPGRELPGGLAVVIPAKDEAARIGATVKAAAGIVVDGVAVSVVVVVDDGSTDATVKVAEEAGAVVVQHPKNKGKSAAMASGAARVASLDRSREGAPRALLFLDADLEGSAAAAAAIAAPVLAGTLDMAIAQIPPQATAGGGRGRVVRLATSGIVRETGWTPTQPLSGNRCLTRKAWDAARPLAPGWGVEVGLTIDLLKDGFRVGEVPAELHHRVTGTSSADQKHRADQYKDVWLALLDRRIRRRESRVVLVATVVSRVARSVLGRG